jgi:hypothetical protein
MSKGLEVGEPGSESLEKQRTSLGARTEADTGAKETEDHIPEV